MRRRTGIVIGTCTALALVGTAGSVVSAGAGVRPSEVGLSAARPSPVGSTPAEVGRRAVPHVTPTTAASVTKPDILPSASSSAPARARGLESTTTRSAGRQRIGELLRVDRLLGNVGGPKRQEFAYPGASYVKVHFDRLTMLPGDYVTVSNPERTESYRYDESDPDGRWAMSITGDTAVVEVHREIDPLGLRDITGDLGIGIDQVARGDSRRAAARPGREESVCGTDTSSDAVCYESKDPVAYTKSKATARLLINGTELCTGWRVGAKNRMITNNHCLTTSGEAYDTEVWFNYQCAKCGGYDVFKPTKVWGDQVLATDKTYDYTLFTVAGFESIEKFGYLTLDTVRPRKGQELYVPQHPSGEPARISGSKGEAAGNCAVDNPDYTGYAAHSDVSYFCDTAGGSSGSPVISRATNRVVALHHFGGCPNSGVRGDLLAGRLRTYL
ncbi:trypsin-like serine peptidase [Actinoplanes flavus]|uniref:Trypsin-like peptidase domain-containing protein n=1 Tax=Actinoplanes flavus TaxID=2820290 RepID=A0ABS3UP61_9ACTN|nr:serine protease [Actinoplanes flavus]MBO3740542.1 trypsin-like peptidase domain-containing protein [Actinoplanes flavus]